MTAQERITEWAELAEAATEGPWFVESDEDEGTRVSYLHQRNGLALLGSVASEGQELFFEDAEHIAASRTAVPAMAAALTAVLGIPRADVHKADDKEWQRLMSLGYNLALEAAKEVIETALAVTP